MGRVAIVEYPYVPCADGSGRDDGPTRHDRACSPETLARTRWWPAGLPGSAPSPLSTKLVLLVDDDDGCRSALAGLLRAVGYSIVEARSGREALRLIAEHEPDAVLSDVQMQDGSGLDLLAGMKNRTRIPVVLMSGALTPTVRAEAIHLGAVACFHKPFPVEIFVAVVDGFWNGPA